MAVRKKKARATAAERKAFFEELDALAVSQKRQYEATRRRRLREFGGLYVPLTVEDASICYYCAAHPAQTQDHCPSLLAIASFGLDYFREQEIPLLLVPACMSCNNERSGQVVFRRGRLRPFSWQAAAAGLKKKLAREKTRGK
jgi:hypothetical protein